MRDRIKQKLHEEIAKKDEKQVEDILWKAMESKKFEKKLGEILKREYKNSDVFEKEVVDIARNVVTQLFKTLWVRRNMWRSRLSNKST